MNETALWINKDKRRFYRAWVYQDLLNDWVLMRIWGSLDTNLGGEKIELVFSLEEGLSKLRGIHKRRISRQYRLVDDGCYLAGLLCSRDVVQQGCCAAGMLCSRDVM